MVCIRSMWKSTEKSSLMSLWILRQVIIMDKDTIQDVIKMNPML